MHKRDWDKDWWDATSPDILKNPDSFNFEMYLQQRRVLQYWLQRVRELEEDIAFLTQEYGNSNEPMTRDALELKKRCRILEERTLLMERMQELEAENRRLREALETLVKNIVYPFKDGEADCGQYDGYFRGLKKAREILCRLQQQE